VEKRIGQRKGVYLARGKNKNESFGERHLLTKSLYDVWGKGSKDSLGMVGFEKDVGDHHGRVKK
jgi:hypothetical protein